MRVACTSIRINTFVGAIDVGVTVVDTTVVGVTVVDTSVVGVTIVCITVVGVLVVKTDSICRNQSSGLPCQNWGNLAGMAELRLEPGCLPLLKACCSKF